MAGRLKAEPAQKRSGPTDSDPPILVVLGTFEPLLRLGLETAIGRADDIALAVVDVDRTTVKSALVDVPAPNVVIIDEKEVHGLSMIDRVNGHRPGTKIMVLTDRPGGAHKIHALAGAISLPKAIATDVLLDTIRAVAAGTYVTELVRLTSREREVLNCLRRGQTYREVACELQISIHTAKEHGTRLRRKLGVTRKHELMGIAVARHLET